MGQRSNLWWDFPLKDSYDMLRIIIQKKIWRVVKIFNWDNRDRRIIITACSITFFRTKDESRNSIYIYTETRNSIFRWAYNRIGCRNETESNWFSYAN